MTARAVTARAVTACAVTGRAGLACAVSMSPSSPRPGTCARLLPGLLLLGALLWTYVCRGEPVTVPGPLVPERVAYYDAAHRNVWSIHDPGFLGFSDFGQELARAGFSVAEMVEPLHELKPRSHDLIIINVAKQLRFTAKEREAVFEFVRAGTSLLVFGEHDNMYGIADGLAPLLEPFGLRLGKDAVGSRRAFVRRADSHSFGISGVFELLSASVSVQAERAHDVLLAAPDGTALAVGVRSGDGRVALLGDSELFWNGDARTGMSAGNNRAFLRKLLVYLGGAHARSGREESAVERAYTFGKGDAVAYFDTASSGRLPVRQPDGLARFALSLVQCGFRVQVGPTRLRDMRSGDVRIIAAPFGPITPNHRGRLLVLGAARHTLLEENFWDRVLLERGARPPDSPYALLEKEYGFDYSSCTQTTDDGTWLSLLRPWPGAPPIRLHRAGGIDLHPDSRLRPWPVAATGPVSSRRHYCRREHAGIDDEQNAGVGAAASRKENAARHLAVASHDLLLLSDSHALTDRYAETPGFGYLAEKLCTWLRGPEKVHPRR